jgi:hypothetical protein
MANPIHTQTVVYKNGSLACLARVENWSAQYITQAATATIAYTVWLLDEDYPDDPNTRTAVSGHEGVALTKTVVIFDALQTGDDRWTDATGYNFLAILDVATLGPAFAAAGRQYLVEFVLTPTAGQAVRWTHLAKAI